MSLMAVLVIIAATTVIALSVGMSGISEVQSGLYINQGNDTLHFADSCAEEAYYRLKLDSTYTGGTVDLGGNSCTITVSGGGSTRTITAEAVIGNFTRTITSDVTLESNSGGEASTIDLTQWQ